MHQLDPCGKLCWLLSSSCLHRAHVLRFSAPDIGRRARARVAGASLRNQHRARNPSNDSRPENIGAQLSTPRALSRARPRPRPSHGVDARALGAPRGGGERARRARSPSGVARPACDSRDACRAPRALPRSGGCGKKCASARRGAPARGRAPHASIVAPRAFHARRATMTPPRSIRRPGPPRGAPSLPRDRGVRPRARREPHGALDRAHALALLSPRRRHRSPRARPHPPRASLRLKSGQGARGDLGVRLPHRASRPVHLRRRRRGISDPERRCVPRTRPRWRFPEPPRRRPAPRRRSPKPRERSKRSPGRRSPAPLPRTRIS